MTWQALIADQDAYFYRKDRVPTLCEMEYKLKHRPEDDLPPPLQHSSQTLFHN